jgi:purine nucleosidase
MGQPIIIDCDPGVDDAIAILLAGVAPEQLDILGITTVAGNVPLTYTARNALRICELANRREIPVYAGCPRPLLRSLQTATHVHGATGLQGATLPEPGAGLQAQHGVNFLIETLMAASAPITLVTLGPLTNLAVALIQQPQIRDRIKRLVAMGGAITHGNITPSAEFNLYVDPHAAQVVFEAGLPLTLITLETTHQVLTTPAHLETLRQMGSAVTTAAADMLTHYGHPDTERYGIAGAPLHDPCVIAYLLNPDLFRLRPAHIQIETTGIHTLGRTVVDWWPSAETPANAQVVVEVDGDGVYELILDYLQRYGSERVGE